MNDSFSRNFEHLDFYNAKFLCHPQLANLLPNCAILYIREGCRKRKLPKFGPFAMVMVPNRFCYWDGNIWAISAKFPMNN